MFTILLPWLFECKDQDTFQLTSDTSSTLCKKMQTSKVSKSYLSTIMNTFVFKVSEDVLQSVTWAEPQCSIVGGV